MKYCAETICKMLPPRPPVTSSNKRRLALELLLVLALIGVWPQIVLRPITRLAAAEQIPLTSVLPKLESLHDEVKSLLIRNAELNTRILSALQAQNNAKIKQVRSSKLLPNPTARGSTAANNMTTTTATTTTTNSTNCLSEKKDAKRLPANNINNKSNAQATSKSASLKTSAGGRQTNSTLTMMAGNQTNVEPALKSVVDFNELADFNKWVELNLYYAVKNTEASAETLREEAEQNNGLVEYSSQALEDGQEGVRYWQSAIMFQDKTLRNEKFDLSDV